MSPHSSTPSQPPLRESEKWVVPPLFARATRNGNFLWAWGRPRAPGPHMLIGGWSMLVLYRIQVSAPLRLSCVRTSGSRPYLGLCNLDFCQGCFSGSPSRGEAGRRPMAWMGVCMHRKSIGTITASPNAMLFARREKEILATFFCL
jgi:hypothetical protein